MRLWPFCLRIFMVSHAAEHGVQTQHQGASCSQHSNLIRLPLNRSGRRASAPRRMKQVDSWPTSSRTPAALTRAWGAKARGRKRHPGLIFFRPLRVKGLFCVLTGRAAFLFRGHVGISTTSCAPSPPRPPRALGYGHSLASPGSYEDFKVTRKWPSRSIQR